MEKRKIAPFLAFNGNAEEAMKFYVSVFPATEITKIMRYGKKHPFATTGEENKVLCGALSLMGLEIMFLDMTNAYPAPAFSWASSIYVDCSSEGEFDTVFKGLAQGGVVMMGPEAVAHFRKCAWVVDKFGVTWQPVLE